MKSRIIVSAITAAALGMGSSSFAQGNDRYAPGNGSQRSQPNVTHQQPGVAQRGHIGPQGLANHPDARNHRNDRYNQNYPNARGPAFRRGGHIPQQYRSRQYVVNDWRGHHLRAPARGQQWLQVGSDYALVAIATGVIASLIYSH